MKSQIYFLFRLCLFITIINFFIYAYLFSPNIGFIIVIPLFFVVGAILGISLSFFFKIFKRKNKYLYLFFIYIIITFCHSFVYYGNYYPPNEFSKLIKYLINYEKIKYSSIYCYQEEFENPLLQSIASYKYKNFIPTESYLLEIGEIKDSLDKIYIEKFNNKYRLNRIDYRLVEEKDAIYIIQKEKRIKILKEGKIQTKDYAFFKYSKNRLDTHVIPFFQNIQIFLRFLQYPIITDSSSNIILFDKVYCL